MEERYQNISHKEEVYRYLEPRIHRMVDARVEEWFTKRRKHKGAIVTTQQLADIVGYTPQGILRKREAGEIRAIPSLGRSYIYDAQQILREVGRANWRNALEVKDRLEKYLISL